MSTERMKAFFDAVLAIIMTILVLDLDQPDSPTLEGLWALRENYLAYALSFLWLGARWINQYQLWEKAEKVSNKVLWLAVLTLFFSSLVPYVTNYVGENFYSRFAQMLYGIIILLVTIFNFWLTNALIKENKSNDLYYSQIHNLDKWMVYDIIGKVIGLVLCYFVWPPLSMICILAVSFMLTYYLQKMYHDLKKAKEKG